MINSMVWVGLTIDDQGPGLKSVDNKHPHCFTHFRSGVPKLLVLYIMSQMSGYRFSIAKFETRVWENGYTCDMFKVYLGDRFIADCHKTVCMGNATVSLGHTTNVKDCTSITPVEGNAVEVTTCFVKKPNNIYLYLYLYLPIFIFFFKFEF